MARPREFDETEVIAKAMFLFWEKGYESASLVDLERATGISKISIYNAFKDKEGLFLAALSHYHEMARQRLQQLVVGHGVEGIERFFANMAAPPDCDSPIDNGCLMVNTALDLRQMGEAVQEKVRVYRELIRCTFATELERSAERGELAEAKGLDEKSEYLVGALWGALATIRMAGTAAAAVPMSKVIADTVRAWRR